MATSTEVDAGLDAIADKIVSATQQIRNGRAMIAEGEAALTGLPAEFDDVKTTIESYEADGGPTGPAEELAVDKLAKFTEEFTGKKNAATAAVAAVASV